MSVTRADREASLKKRYAGRVAAAPKRRGMGRGPGAPRGGGRPKSTGAALKRLLSYLKADRLQMGIAFFCVICKHGGDTDRFLSAAPDHQPLYRTAGRKSRRCGGTFLKG